MGLSFITFPAIVSQMPGGPLFGALFFGSLVMAGFTSLLSVLQVVSSAFQDKFGITARQASIRVGSALAIVSVLLFSTTTGLIALDTVDQWANNIGIVAAAIAATILVIWVFRKGPELAGHLNAVSTFKVGRVWQLLVGILAPAVLLYMLIQRIIVLVTEGYEGYPLWYLAVAGWGTIAVIVIGAITMTVLRWKHDPDDFTPWPSTTALKELKK